MVTRFRRIVFSCLSSVFLGMVLLPAAASQQGAAPNPNRPTLFIVGSLPSGELHDLFDPNRIRVVESAAGGQTSRAYIKSGAWEQVAAQIRPGDFVLIEFNPDDQTEADRDSANRTLHGMGDGTFDYLDPGTLKVELVHSYGWYLRKIVVDAINHGANPLLCSPAVAADPSAIAKNGNEPGYGDWARAIAVEQRIPFVDLSGAGAGLTAPGMWSALEALKPDPLAAYLVRPHGS